MLPRNHFCSIKKPICSIKKPILKCHSRWVVRTKCLLHSPAQWASQGAACSTRHPPYGICEGPTLLGASWGAAHPAHNGFSTRVVPHECQFLGVASSSGRLPQFEIAERMRECWPFVPQRGVLCQGSRASVLTAPTSCQCRCTLLLLF